MLEKLLAEIRAGGTFETGELAVRLGTTPEMLDAMLGHLLRSGEIQRFDACGDSCGDCGLGKTCRPRTAEKSPGNEIRLFTVQIP
jgi:hypothetical protein